MILAGLLALIGVTALVGAAMLLHPAAGLGLFGLIVLAAARAVASEQRPATPPAGRQGDLT